MTHVTRGDDGVPTIHVHDNESIDTPEVRKVVAEVVQGALGRTHGEMTDEVDYVRSGEVETVAVRLRARHRLLFAPLDELTIAYCLRNVQGEIQETTIDALAKAMKAPALWRDLFAVDAVIWVDERYWTRFTEAEREAVVLHELCHITVNDKGRVKLADHDVEEFGMVVRLYGPWRPDVARFGKQLALFESGKN